MRPSQPGTHVTMNWGCFDWPASRPQMHFVPIKTVEQQGMLCVHRLREGLKTDRTACVNRIRGLLAEFGLVFGRT